MFVVLLLLVLAAVLLPLPPLWSLPIVGVVSTRDAAAAEFNWLEWRWFRVGWWWW